MILSESEINKLTRRIIMETHVIEKGLSMPESRRLFGLPRVELLCSLIDTYIKKYSKEDEQVLHAINVLKEYIYFNECNGDTIPEETKKCLDSVLKEFNDIDECNSSNLVEYDKSQIWKNYNSFTEFSLSRKSLRNYSSKIVSQELLVKAVNLSKYAPSACNRQSVRYHLYTDINDISRILVVQGGNKGFGHLAKFVIVVTYDCSNYFEENERNLGYVDGGIASLNLLYSLHELGLACCILNASNNIKKDKNIRSIIDIPDSENIVCYVAGGYPVDKFKIADSKRYSTEHIMTIH